MNYGKQRWQSKNMDNSRTRSPPNYKGGEANKEYVIAQKVQKTGVSFYEVTDWKYDERKRLYQPTIRRIVIIKNTNTQLSLNL